MTAPDEIVIIGGGPAGAVIASRLAELSHDVVLLEKARFPRPHVGEALTPGVAEQLAFLGLSDVLDLAVVRHTLEFELKWATARFDPYTAMQPGILVDRARFDANLILAAQRRGVHIVQGNRARIAERSGDSWRIACDGPDGPSELRARIVIDASGRRGFLPRKRRKHYRLIAIQGRFRGNGLPACVRVAAGDTAWAWGAPMSDGTYAAMVFLDPHDVKSAGGNLEQRFRGLVSACGLLDDVGGTELVDTVDACDAAPYLDYDAVGADFLKVGDSCLAIDPISSAGVQTAIQLAVAGAVAVHTLRGDPESAQLIAEFWPDELARRSTRHRAWSAQFYDQAGSRLSTPFWRARSTMRIDAVAPAVSFDGAPLPSPDEALRLASSVRVMTGACIVGNAVERRRLVTHPSLAEPVAFLGNADLPNLLARISPGMTAAATLNAWSRIMEPVDAIKALSWVWQRGLVEPMVATSTSRARYAAALAQ